MDYATDDAGIIKLANGVIAAEMLLPEKQRFPGLSVLQECTRAASAGLIHFETGRAGTSASAPSVEQAFAAAQEIARDVVNGLMYFHRRELPMAEEWGVEVTRSKSGDRTKLPRTQDRLIKMLGKASEKEKSLPEAERLPHPKVAEITAARDNLVNVLAQRAEANTLREQGLLVRVAESASVFRLLQLCAHWHIVMDFDGAVDAQLQSMGFTVVEIPAKVAKTPIEPTEPPIPVA